MQYTLNDALTKLKEILKKFKNILWNWLNFDNNLLKFLYNKVLIKMTLYDIIRMGVDNVKYRIQKVCDLDIA